jgi:hypothetical protein
VSQNEILIFSVLGCFGVLAGIAGGILGARRRVSGAKALWLSVLLAATVPLWIMFALTAVEQLILGRGLGTAFVRGAAMATLLSLSMPFVSGLPAAIACPVTFWLTHRVYRPKGTPPLPS